MRSLVERCLVLLVGLSLALVACAATAAHSQAASNGCSSVAYDCTPGYNANNTQGTWAWSHYGDIPGNDITDRNGRNHNCTLYAAWRLQQSGMQDPGNWGNAVDWAARIGGGDHDPSVGSIAWYDATASNSSGHVAFVEQVNGSQVLIRADNFSESVGSTTAGWVEASSVGLFLHPHDTPQVIDSDHDGIPNSSDQCPDQAGPASTGGCPDSDGDGVADRFDRCPGAAGPGANGGCPWPYSNQLLRNGSFERGFGGWGGMSHAESVNVASYTNTSYAHDGDGYGEMNSAVDGGSVGQNIAVNVAAGDSYSVSIWLRAAPGVGSFSGNLRLWGLGVSANEGSDTRFTVSEQWTLVTSPLDAHDAHNQLRAEIYLDSRGNLDADGAQVVRVGLRAASFEPGSPAGWHAVNEASSVNFAAYEDGDRAHDGQGYGEMNSSGTNGSVGQDIATTVQPGDSYSFSIWLRAAPGTSVYSGNLKLWGLGQTTDEGFGTPFTVGDRWTLVTAPLDAKGNHDHLRAEIYLSSPGNLDADGAQVVKTGLSSASFESGFDGWRQQSQAGSVNLASYTDRNRSHDGSGFGEMNSAVDGGSVSQDVSVSVAAGDSYAFSVWLRAAPGTGSFTGVLHLWGLGVTANEGSDTHFTVGSQWTQVTAPLDAQTPHNQLRAEIYMYTRGSLDADGATLVVGGARAAASTLQVAEPTLAPAIVGTPWSTTLAASGGTPSYAWSVQSGELPAGLALTPDGMISGTPTTVGTATATLAVMDMSVPKATATRTVTITVGDPLRVAVGALPGGVLSVPYSTTLTALGAAGATSWSVLSGALPSGLRLARTGVLSGRPTAPGTYRFVVQVTDSASPAQSATTSLVVKVVAVAVGTTAVPSGAITKPYSTALTAQGGVGSRTWTITSGVLPSGVTLSSDGRLAGTPSTAGTYRFVATVTDSASPVNTASRSLQLVVAPIAVRTVSLKAGTVGRAYTQSLSAWGGTAPLRWTVVSGALPPGLALSAAGVVSGTPSAPGTYEVTVKVADAARRTAIATYPVVVS